MNVFLFFALFFVFVCFFQFKHILFAQMGKKDKTQVKQTYEVFFYVYNKYRIRHKLNKPMKSSSMCTISITFFDRVFVFF